MRELRFPPLMETRLRDPGKRLARRAEVMVAASVALVLAATLFPFHFRFDLAHLLEKSREIEWEIYYTDRPGHVSIDRDLLQNLVLFMPLGASLGARAAAPRPRRDALVALGVGAALSITVELLQLLTEERVTQLADVWRNAVGACLAALVVSALRARKNRASL